MIEILSIIDVNWRNNTHKIVLFKEDIKMRTIVLLPSSEPDHFKRFQQSLERSDLIDFLQDGLIGADAKIPGQGVRIPLSMLIMWHLGVLCGRLKRS